MSTPEEPRISLNEIARQMREQRKAEQDTQTQMTRELREAHPQSAELTSTRGPAPEQTPARTGLRALALAARLQIAAVVLVMLSFFGVVFFSDPMARATTQRADIPEFVLRISCVLYGLASWWLAFRLFRWIGVIVFLALGFFVVFSPAGFLPVGARAVLAILVFFVLNGVATNVLKKRGAKVRFWGASPAQLPE